MPKANSPPTGGRRRRIAEIQLAACRLVIANGYDGFTMTELAEAVGVSRRTLFNYVPDKQSAVLGCAQSPEHPALARFIAGGPTGVPLDDVLVAIEDVIADEFGSSAQVATHHTLVEQAIISDPKLLRLATDRFLTISELIASAMSEREGWPAGDLRAKAFAATLVALLKVTLDELAERQDNSDFTTVFHEVLAADAAARGATA